MKKKTLKDFGRYSHPITCDWCGEFIELNDICEETGSFGRTGMMHSTCPVEWFKEDEKI